MLLDIARMLSTDTGTGSPITLTTAAPSYLTFLDAGAVDGLSYYYGIKDGNAREVGIGVVGSSGTTITRSVIRSTNSNNPIVLTGNQQVYITALTQSIGLQPIASVLTSGSQASVSFASIPGTYKDLIVSVQGRIIRAGSQNDQLAMRFNNSSGADYAYQLLSGFGTSPFAAADAGQSEFNVGALPASTATANFAGQVELVISNYAGTVFFKTFTSAVQVPVTQTGIQQGSGMWNNTAAINRLDLFPDLGTGFVDGSRFALYGRP